MKDEESNCQTCFGLGFSFDVEDGESKVTCPSCAGSGKASDSIDNAALHLLAGLLTVKLLLSLH